MVKELKWKDFLPYREMMREKEALNLFFLNDSELYTFGKEINVYHTPGLLMLWYRKISFVLFRYGDPDYREASSFLLGKNPSTINGPRDALEGLVPYMGDGWSFTVTPMMSVTKESFRKAVQRSDNLSFLLTYEDFMEASMLYAESKEFSEGFETEDDRINWSEMKETMEYPFAATGYRIGRRLVGTAMLSAATKESAMVTSVFVEEGERGKGIGTQLAQEITDIALNEHLIKTLSLFPSGERSRKIYSTLGYREVGEYSYLRKKP